MASEKNIIQLHMESNTTMNKPIPAMTSPAVHSYLKKIGGEWTGRGNVLELGCWLGGSLIPLLEGLNEAGYNRWVWCYDRWKANDEQVKKAQLGGVSIIPEQDLRPLFLDNVTPVYDKVYAIKGSMPDTLQAYIGYPIEICILDAPKQEPVFTESIRRLSPSWLPGVTILGLLDYKFYERHTGRKRFLFEAPVRFMDKYGDCFEIIKEWDDECPVFFKYIKELKFDRNGN